MGSPGMLPIYASSISVLAVISSREGLEEIHPGLAGQQKLEWYEVLFQVPLLKCSRQVCNSHALSFLRLSLLVCVGEHAGQDKGHAGAAGACCGVGAPALLRLPLLQAAGGLRRCQGGPSRCHAPLHTVFGVAQWRPILPRPWVRHGMYLAQAWATQRSLAIRLSANRFQALSVAEGQDQALLLHTWAGLVQL